MLDRWWPLLIVLLAVLILINDLKGYLWATLVAAYGVLAQLKVLGYIEVNPWQLFWPNA